MKPFHHSSSDSGLSILEMLVAIAILSIVTVVVLRYQSETLKVRTKAEMLRSRSSIKDSLLKSTACDRMVACKGKEFLNLFDEEGRILVSNNGTTKFGPWTVIASCLPDKSFEVKIASLQNKTFKKDPMTQKPLDWTAEDSVLIGSNNLCMPLDVGKESVAVRVVKGPHCGPSQGTCAPPPLYPSDPGTPSNMCCEDGRNGARPNCDAGEYEVGAYWDRDGDWGMQGAWVVLCR